MVIFISVIVGTSEVVKRVLGKVSSWIISEGTWFTRKTMGVRLRYY